MGYASPDVVELLSVEERLAWAERRPEESLLDWQERLELRRRVEAGRLAKWAAEDPDWRVLVRAWALIHVYAPESPMREVVLKRLDTLAESMRPPG